MYISHFFHRFNFLPYTVELNYQPTLLSSQQEIAVVILGPLFNLAVFLLLIGLCVVLEKSVGKFPDFGCKFIMAYGIMTFLDPYLILGIDCILGVRKFSFNSNFCIARGYNSFKPKHEVFKNKQVLKSRIERA